MKKGEDKILIGDKLKELRKAQRLSLSELAKLTGVQIATLSRIEHNKMTGTIETHHKIAYFLEIELSELYRGIKIKHTTVEVTGLKETPDIVTRGDVSAKLLTKNIDYKKMIPTLLTLNPNGTSAKEKITKELFLFVTTGQIEVNLGEESYSLAEEEAIYINPGKEYSIKNTQDKIAKLIKVTAK